MSLLTTVSYFCRRSGVPVPASVAGSTDIAILQVLALLEEEGNDLAMRGGWEGLTFEAAHTTIAAEDQGAIATIAANGYRYIKNNTIWDRTTQLPVCGPMDSIEWQRMKALTTASFRFRHRIRGGKLLVTPVPDAGLSWYFEYCSQNWITDSTGATYKQYFTADDDIMLLPESLLVMGLRWRWAAQKGFDYAELFNSYEMQVKDTLGRDGGKPRLYADGDMRRGPRPGIVVPEGSWSL